MIYYVIILFQIVGYLYSKVFYDDTDAPADYRFVKMNKSYELMIGIQAKDWIGQKMSELYETIRKGPESWDAFHDRFFAQYTKKK